MIYDPNKVVSIDYTNYRVERSTRVIIPGLLAFTATEYHPKPQWLLMSSYDIDKSNTRDFAMADVHKWTP
jgi:hypothetical protein